MGGVWSVVPRVAHRAVPAASISRSARTRWSRTVVEREFYPLERRSAHAVAGRDGRLAGMEADDQLIARCSPAIALRMPPDQRDRHADHARRLVERTAWETAHGFEVDDAGLALMVHTVAAHAAVLVAGFTPATQPYRDVSSVVLHRGTIVNREPRPGPVRGVMSDAPQHLAGQAGHGRGPVLLDWRSVARDTGRPDAGVNVVYHEFAHKLDGLDGVFDGMPPLGSDAARAEWEQVLGTNYRRLVRRGGDPVIRSYAATNEVEFFAVTTELFFTVPERLRAAHARVYARLADFYAQDPAATL